MTSQWDDPVTPEYFPMHNAAMGENGELQDLWYKTRIKRRFGLLFARIRKAAKLTTAEVASATKWEESYVLDLEGSLGDIPDIQIITRYVEACGGKLGIVVTAPSDGRSTKIVDALVMPLDSERDTPALLDFLREKGEENRGDKA